MTARIVIKAGLAFVGAALIVALLHSHVPFERHGAWYAFGLILAFAGCNPRAMATMAAMIGLAVIFYVVFWQNSALLGFRIPHAAICLLMAVALHFLDDQDEIEQVKCRSCFWRGPLTKLKHKRCPHCGSSDIVKTDRTVLT